MLIPKRIGNMRLYNADCLDVLNELDRVDCMVTDPPYGVGFTGKARKDKRVMAEYVYTDDDTNFADLILPRVRLALKKTDRAAIFSGRKQQMLYPPADDIGGVVATNGVGQGPWGWGVLHPVLYYGKATDHARKTPAGRSFSHVTTDVLASEHPCPKPLEYMRWLVERASYPGETVLDPFMGSGTTALACILEGRSFIGVEIDARFFRLALERITLLYESFGRSTGRPKRGLVY